MRYAKATDDFYVPEPEDVRTQVGKPGAYSFEPVEPTSSPRRRATSCARSTSTRTRRTSGSSSRASRASWPARCCPVGAYTEFYWTVNARSLMNFVSLRAAETAQREIRRYAEAVERFFAEHMPVTHAAFVANEPHRALASASVRSTIGCVAVVGEIAASPPSRRTSSACTAR